MKTETALRVSLQKIHLLLQFEGIGKVVVAVAESGIFAATAAEQGAHIRSLAASARQQHWPDACMPVRIGCNDVLCTVSGAMINNNMLYGKVRPLC